MNRADLREVSRNEVLTALKSIMLAPRSSAPSVNKTPSKKEAEKPHVIEAVRPRHACGMI